MHYGFSLDPCIVLGVSQEASLQEIRDAYREKAKRHHPDQGGDEWAFRVVSQSYEILGQARVAGRMAGESASSSPAPPPPPRVSPIKPPPPHSGAWQSEKTRDGIHDAVSDPARIVDVEMFSIRYAMSSPLQMLRSPEQRTLSCSLNISWPSKAYAGRDDDEASAEILKLVAKAFAPLARKTRATGSRSSSEDGRFDGLLSYASAAKGEEALEALHRAVLAQGLGLSQRTREMIVPRDDP